MGAVENLDLVLSGCDRKDVWVLMGELFKDGNIEDIFRGGDTNFM